jgi:hypothetical protein
VLPFAIPLVNYAKGLLADQLPYGTEINRGIAALQNPVGFIQNQIRDAAKQEIINNVPAAASVNGYLENAKQDVANSVIPQISSGIGSLVPQVSSPAPVQDTSVQDTSGPTDFGSLNLPADFFTSAPSTDTSVATPDLSSFSMPDLSSLNMPDLSSLQNISMPDMSNYGGFSGGDYNLSEEYANGGQIYRRMYA